MKTVYAFFLVALVACGGSQTQTERVPAPRAAAELPPPPPAPKLRLGRDVVPTRYAVDLTVDPSADEFGGTVHIDVQLAAATTGIWLNADEIQVADAALTAGGTTTALRALPAPDGARGLVGFATDRVVGPGAARLDITYRARFQTNETAGVFKQKTGGDWYVFTQFEAIDARRGFPCFDDPSLKAPWSITLHVPKDLVAAANTAVASETPDGAAKIVRFEESRPLPSYLVAFAVGPFEVVDGGKSKSGVPVRIFAFKGRADEAAYAADSTRQILDTLEDYFGIPYPFGKLDSVPIPRTIAFGAMENPGLVTYVEGLLLAKKANDTFDHRHRYATVCAHELAHQWFGDLVTLAYWNDTWLNESFATWMEVKAIARWQPGWHTGEDRAEELSRSLDGDTLTTARAVRQPIESENDIANAFDNITYGKGSAVLAMFESYLGEETFQRGVRAYLEAHRFGNATASDFFAAVGAAAGTDVSTPFSSFVDQAGEPLVSVKLTCDKGAAPRLDLEQRRNLLPGQPEDDRLWQIPVCVRTAAGRTCTLLSGRSGAIELPGQCPAWVVPNAGALGYYRSALAGDGLARLVAHRKELTPAETVGLVGDLAALERDGTVPAAEVLAALPALGVAGEPSAAALAVTLLRQIRRTLVSTQLRPAFARYVQKLFGARARALGFVPRPGEPPEEMGVRQEIVPLVAVDGDDRELQAEAQRLAFRWLDDPKALHPDLVSHVLAIVARTRGDRAYLDKLEATLDRTTDLGDRQPIVAALGTFRDPALLTQAMAFLFDEKRDVREALGAVYSRRRVGEISEPLYAWLREHYDGIAQRLPRQGRGFLVRLAGVTLCDEDKLKDFEEFFQERAQRVVGGPRTYSSALAGIKTCVAQKKVQAPSVTRFFTRGGAS